MSNFEQCEPIDLIEALRRQGPIKHIRSGFWPPERESSPAPTMAEGIPIVDLLRNTRRLTGLGYISSGLKSDYGKKIAAQQRLIPPEKML